MTTEAKDLVRRWIDEIYTHQRFECIRDLAAAQVICHDDEGSRAIVPRDYELQVKQMFHLGTIPTGRRVYTLVAEEKRVAALGACLNRHGDRVSYWLHVFGVHRSQISELWLSGYVVGVDWGIMLEEISMEPNKGTEAENKATVRRWWDEMYGENRLDELMPVLAGPRYVRHEPTGTWSNTITDHLLRIKKLYSSDQGRPRLHFKYDLVAEGDKVVGFGTLFIQQPNSIEQHHAHSFVQMFRLEERRIVETWFPGWCVGVDWTARYQIDPTSQIPSKSSHK